MTIDDLRPAVFLAPADCRRAMTMYFYELLKRHPKLFFSFVIPARSN